MMSTLKSSQRGISFLGLLFVAGTLGVAGVIGAQVVPTVIEFQAVKRAAVRAAQAPSGTMAEVRATFDKQAAVDDIKSINGKDIEVTKEGDKVVVKFAYQREIHLTGPAWLTLKYEGSSK
jgi:hypothetical protein